MGWRYNFLLSGVRKEQHETRLLKILRHRIFLARYCQEQDFGMSLRAHPIEIQFELTASPVEGGCFTWSRCVVRHSVASSRETKHSDRTGRIPHMTQRTGGRTSKAFRGSFSLVTFGRCYASMRPFSLPGTIGSTLRSIYVRRFRRARQRSIRTGRILRNLHRRRSGVRG